MEYKYEKCRMKWTLQSFAFLMILIILFRELKRFFHTIYIYILYMFKLLIWFPLKNDGASLSTNFHLRDDFPYDCLNITSTQCVSCFTLRWLLRNKFAMFRWRLSVLKVDKLIIYMHKCLTYKQYIQCLNSLGCTHFDRMFCFFSNRLSAINRKGRTIIINLYYIKLYLSLSWYNPNHCLSNFISVTIDKHSSLFEIEINILPIMFSVLYIFIAFAQLWRVKLLKSATNCYFDW